MKNLLACVALLLFMSAGASATAVFGTVDDMTGSASVTGADGSTSGLSVGMKIYEKDTIKTGADGEVQIATQDGAFLALRPNSEFRIDAYKAEGGSDDKSFLSLLVGGLRSITGWIGGTNHDAYRITTPTATIGVRGTDHEVTVVAPGGSDAAGTYETVNDGSTVMKTAQGEVVDTPGKFVFAARGARSAPAFLHGTPHFWGHRHLRLEGRIAGRKAYLRGHREQMRQQRMREFHPAGMSRRGGQAAAGQRGAEPRGATRGGAFGQREGMRGRTGRAGGRGMRQRDGGGFRQRQGRGFRQDGTGGSRERDRGGFGARGREAAPDTGGRLGRRGEGGGFRRR